MLESAAFVSRRALASVVALQWAALVLASWVIGAHAWDDGAITLAFARTFAQHGTIALTPSSEQIEGFSSVSWFLLNAAVALARPSFATTIFVSQVLAATCIAGATVWLARLCRRLELDRATTWLVVLSWGCWGCSFAEASNGMEMGLLAWAMLVNVDELMRPAPRGRWLAFATALAILTRFEACLFVGLLALAVARVPGRRAFGTIVASALATVVVLTVLRGLLFHDVLPNTFWAKRWPPYAAFSGKSRWQGATELPWLLSPPALLAVFVGRAAFRRGATGDEVGRRTVAGLSSGRLAAILLLPVLGAVVFGALIGKAWGYYGRMPYFAFPLAMLFLGRATSSWLGDRGARAGVCVVAWGLAVALSMKGFPSTALRTSWAWGSDRVAVTPAAYASSGRVFARVLDAAGERRRVLLTPDLGGLALAFPAFRVVDLGLLADRTLAHQGPGAVAQVLEAETPSLIEAHGEWARVGQLYETPAFRAHYVPAFAERTKLWLRRESAEALVARGGGCWLSPEVLDVRLDLEAHRYEDFDTAEDRRVFRERGPIVALAEPSARWHSSRGTVDPCEGLIEGLRAGPPRRINPIP